MAALQQPGRRYSPNRRKIRFDAALVVDDDLIPVIILVVSFDGMRLSIPGTVETGSPVTIKSIGVDIPAVVHWCQNGYAGVHLLERLNSETLKYLETARDELARIARRVADPLDESNTLPTI